MKCPLCLQNAFDFKKVQGRKEEYFWRCSQCKLIFRPEKAHISSASEKERYLTHDNSMENRGYVDFLLKPYEFALKHLHARKPILDYGCGFNPVFAKLMKQKGWECDYFDPYFFPDGIQQSKYANIFSIETVEHFNYPHKDWDKLNRLLEDGGILTVMTDLWTDQKLSPDWYYLNDKTHACFYHMDTLKWIADHFKWTIRDTDKNRIVIFKK